MFSFGSLCRRFRDETRDLCLLVDARLTSRQELLILAERALEWHVRHRRKTVADSSAAEEEEEDDGDVNNIHPLNPPAESIFCVYDLLFAAIWMASCVSGSVGLAMAIAVCDSFTICTDSGPSQPKDRVWMLRGGIGSRMQVRLSQLDRIRPGSARALTTLYCFKSAVRDLHVRSRLGVPAGQAEEEEKDRPSRCDPAAVARFFADLCTIFRTQIAASPTRAE